VASRLAVPRRRAYDIATAATAEARPQRTTERMTDGS